MVGPLALWSCNHLNMATSWAAGERFLSRFATCRLEFNLFVHAPPPSILGVDHCCDPQPWISLHLIVVLLIGCFCCRWCRYLVSVCMQV